MLRGTALTSLGDQIPVPRKATRALLRDSSQQPIRINHLLKQTGGEWKVYDVTVDEISITANYRNQFNRVLNDGGYDKLIGMRIGNIGGDVK